VVIDLIQFGEIDACIKRAFSTCTSPYSGSIIAYLASQTCPKAPDPDVHNQRIDDNGKETKWYNYFLQPPRKYHPDEGIPGFNSTDTWLVFEGRIDCRNLVVWYATRYKTGT
jgi:hypothetical protein